MEEDTPLHEEEAPVEVRAVPRLRRDVACLLELTDLGLLAILKWTSEVNKLV